MNDRIAYSRWLVIRYFKLEFINQSHFLRIRQIWYLLTNRSFSLTSEFSRARKKMPSRTDWHGNLQKNIKHINWPAAFDLTFQTRLSVMCFFLIPQNLKVKSSLKERQEKKKIKVNCKRIIIEINNNIILNSWTYITKQGDVEIFWTGPCI